MAKAARSSSVPPERVSTRPSIQPQREGRSQSKISTEETHAMLLARRALELSEEVPTPGRTSAPPPDPREEAFVSDASAQTVLEQGHEDAEERAFERSSEFGSFLADLSRPSETTDFRVHDRTHLEFSIDYRLRETHRVEKFEWEAYFFAPESLRLDSRTYSKEDVYEDLQTYVRFGVPDCTYHELVELPLTRVRTSLASNDAELAIRELRLIACQGRASGAEAKKHIVQGLSSGEDRSRFLAAAHRMIADTRVISERLQEVLALGKGRPDPLETAVLWIDEDVSRLLETLMGNLANGVRKSDAGTAEVRNGVIAAAEAEAVRQARYRDASGLEGVGRLGMKGRRIEQIEFRRHVLKRFTSSVLWLSPEVRPAATWGSPRAERCRGRCRDGVRGRRRHLERRRHVVEHHAMGDRRDHRVCAEGSHQGAPSDELRRGRLAQLRRSPLADSRSRTKDRARGHGGTVRLPRVRRSA